MENPSNLEKNCWESMSRSTNERMNREVLWKSFWCRSLFLVVVEIRLLLVEEPEEENIFVGKDRQGKAGG